MLIRNKNFKNNFWVGLCDVKFFYMLGYILDTILKPYYQTGSTM